ncbi:hypothetical protein LZ648_01225 [Shewanella chilikensis]|nr:hypothetical protein [Shewanella chilikensis]MCE9786287.1 hypothetical protein [Shewanella chilikensis]
MLGFQQFRRQQEAAVAAESGLLNESSQTGFSQLPAPGQISHGQSLLQTKVGQRRGRSFGIGETANKSKPLFGAFLAIGHSQRQHSTGAQGVLATGVTQHYRVVLAQ